MSLVTDRAMAFLDWRVGVLINTCNKIGENLVLVNQCIQCYRSALWCYQLVCGDLVSTDDFCQEFHQYQEKLLDKRAMLALSARIFFLS